MHKHRLFRGSLENQLLNSSMQEERSRSDSPPVVQTRKRKKKLSEEEKDSEEHESCSTQNSPEIGDFRNEQPFDEEKENAADNLNAEKTENSDDSMDVSSFFSSAVEKRPYSFEEDEEIVNFVLKGQNIYKTSSILLWKYLEAKKSTPPRTYQSLKNRFLRSIKPKLFTTYRHLIRNQNQVKDILTKFPELKKDFKRKPILFDDQGSETDERFEHTAPKKTVDRSAASFKESVPVEADSGTPVSQREKLIEEENTSKTREVKFSENTILVTVSNSRIPVTSVTTPNFESIFDKYSRHKKKNKLIPCSACGRCWEPELEETQDSDSDDAIPGSNDYFSKSKGTR